MLTIKNIMTDIKSELRSYDESGLIDDITLELHLINELKRFGGNVMEVYPKIIEIRNSQGQLPKNFFSLYKAVKTEPMGCSVDEGVPEEALIGNYFYRIRKEASTYWDNQSKKFIEGDYLEVTEKVYLNDGTKADFYYGNNQPLKLVEGFDRSGINLQCENVLIKKAPYEINIIHNTVQTNFPRGFICIWYQGLMMEEETEEIILPEDPNARIYQFLMYSGKAKIFEMLWNNDDDPNVINKLQYNKQEMEKARLEASAQVRFKSVSGKNWWEGFKGKQRKRVRIFENYGIGR